MLKWESIINHDFGTIDLSVEEGLELYLHAPLTSLMHAAHQLRMKLHPAKEVSWIIDRNVNLSNICISGCLFCNFHVPQNSQKAYVTDIHAYRQKITELFELGGQQLLLQGGMHQGFDLTFYTSLFKQLKLEFPALKLHALGPPEVAFLSKLEGMSFSQVLIELKQAGLDSLPGAGAEILNNEIRQKISRAKCSVEDWYGVMRAAHQLNITTTATMMFGHIEEPIHRIRQLADIRQVQSEKPEKAKGFISFIPWTFQGENTRLAKRFPIHSISSEMYLRTIAIARLMLPNIQNIQPSWLTVGREVAQLALWGGANDLGSVMIEEHVVSSAGANYVISIDSMQHAIIQAGFVPVKRNQQFEKM